MIKGKKIYLQKTTLKDWIDTREARFSKEILKYDSLQRPMPSPEEEKKFFSDYVGTGKYVIFNICKKNSGIIGFINAFSFNREKALCETGIMILSPENYGKGYGKEAYEIFLKYLKKEHNLKTTYILTHPHNKRALNLYKKLGYKDLGMVKDPPDLWQCMEYKF